MPRDLAIYAALRLSGLLALLAFAAVLVLKGGWEAAAAGLMVAAGIAFGLTFIALLTDRDRMPGPRRA